MAAREEGDAAASKQAARGGAGSGKRQGLAGGDPRKRSEEDNSVCPREREEMQQQVNRPREANASLEEIRVQQNDQIIKLLGTEKMSAKQATQELDAERIGKEDALQQDVAQQAK